MPLGRRGPGLVGMAARTAVVVGTANAVSKKQQKKYANQQEQQAASAEAAPAAAPQDDLATQLESLAKLRDQGILTEEEFSAKKAQILGI
jgi:membrane protease subunit (stomatin/prohibitin family)